MTSSQSAAANETATTQAAPTPTIISVSAVNPDDAYGIDAEIDITVTFDQVVEVAGGRPTLQLETGSRDALAEYDSGSGTATLTFKYKVQGGESSTDLNYFSTGSLSANGAIVTAYGTGTQASLVLPALNRPESLAGSKALVIDTLAPTLAITSSPGGRLKAGESAVITFTFSEKVDFARGDIQVEGGTLGDLTSNASGTSYTATFMPAQGVNNGSASITVAAGSYADLAGNGGGPGMMPSIAFDTLAPGRPAAPVLQAGSDTGAGGDGITSIARPGFSGAAGSVEGLSTVRVYADSALIAQTSANADGSWDAASVVDLADRTHAITVIASDGAGNESAASPSLALTVDVHAPAMPSAPVLAIGSDSGIRGDGITNNHRPTFVGSAESGATVNLYDARGNVIGTGTAFNGAWAIAPVVALAEGKHTISARAVDAAGNVSAAATGQEITIDLTAPTLSITSNASWLKIGDTATITFTFSEDPGASFAREDIDVKGGTLGALVKDGRTFTAMFTPTGNLDTTTASITVGAGAYVDAAGNNGGPGLTPALVFDTRAPAVSVPDLEAASDTGSANDDDITGDTTPTFTGTGEEGATVTLFAGALEIGSGVVADGHWRITSGIALAGGRHLITAGITDALGNHGPRSGALEIDVITDAPTNMATSLAFSDDTGASWDDLVTRTASQVISGKLSKDLAAGEHVEVSLDGGKTWRQASVNDDSWSVVTVLAAGEHVVSVRVVNAIGNAGETYSRDYYLDNVAPDAPDVPALAAQSDTGDQGDGRTESTTQVIEGSGAAAGATVYLYDGDQRIGTGKAGQDGKWSIEVALGVGTYALSTTQDDKAGNESPNSDPFQLAVVAPDSNPNPNPNPTPNPTPTPTPTPKPPTMLDGVPVTIRPVTLPGGVRGTAIEVPIVTGDRTESDGSTGLADIPLASSGGQTQLLAQLPVGYGLSASGASVGPDGGLAFLIASIRAATPAHASGDQGHLVHSGAAFLQDASYGALLVQTVRPVSNQGATGPLVLTGFDPSGSQDTALVIDTGGLAGDATIALAGIDFAALVGDAVVRTGGSGTILAGDGASQHITVVSGGENAVFAGGGSDVLGFVAPDPGSASGRASAQALPGAAATLLHGGQGRDAAVFSGLSSDYQVDFHNGHVVVGSKALPGAAAIVVNVEELRFADGVIEVGNGAALATLAGMYATVLGRQADVHGIAFWADRIDAGADWGTVALGMIASDEHVALHGAMDGALNGTLNGDPAHDIGLLYRALFDRAADAAGLAFWQAAMEGGMGLEQVAGHFVESAEMIGLQRGALDWDFLV